MPESSEITCAGCGEVFTNFLQEMADRNAKVTCPKCGQTHDCGSAAHSQEQDGAA